MVEEFLGAFDAKGLPESHETGIETAFRSTQRTGQCRVFSSPLSVICGGDVAQDKEITAAFSGFISNEGELRAAHPGAPNGSAGLLLHLFLTEPAWKTLIWGEYAAAIYDARHKSITLLRDRVGFYPLFVTRLRGTTYFSTSIAALFAIPGIVRRPSMETLARFLGTHYRHVEGDRRVTSFDGIEKVPAGTVEQITENGRHEESYWDSRHIPLHTKYASEAEAAEVLRSLLSDAVRRRASNELARSGFALSSGMDSSSILALATEGRRQRPFIFTTSFGGWADNEAADARETAALYGDWRPIVIEHIGDFLDAADNLHIFHDEPVVTVSWLWDFLMQKEVAAQGCSLFFGGLGGDELFAGEFEHFFFHFADLDNAGEQEALDHEIKEWIRHHDHPVHKKDRALLESVWQRMRNSRGRVKTDPLRHGRYLSALSPDIRAGAGRPPELENPWDSYLRNRLWQDFRSETTLPCLRATINSARANGLEIRFPFLDHRVVEFAMALPGSWKIRDGITKRILRRAMRGILPDNVLQRERKIGWASPADQMFRGSALKKLDAHLNSSAWKTRPLYDQNVLSRIISEHQSAVADHAMFLWQLAAVEAWWRRWFS